MTTTSDPPPATSAGCGCPQDRAAGLTRRGLFRVAAAAGLATATTATGARLAFGAATDADVLVVLSLRGGMDGLSAVVPVGDPDYAPARPSIAVPGALLKPAGSVFGLHPALAPLYPWWDAGRLAAVHAVGQASPTRSHFAAMAELERAAPGSSLRTGWIDRTIGLDPAAGVFAATQVGNPVLPSALVGPAPEFALSTLANVRLSLTGGAVTVPEWQAALGALHAGARPELVRPTARALDAVARVGPLATPSSHTAAGYPDSALGRALHDVARLTRSTLGLRVATVDVGDWDMHEGLGTAAPGGWMYDHLGDLAASMAAFATELGPDLSRVTLVTLSEFGRRVAQNGSGGVDHGHGNVVLLLGGGVRGGRVYGRWPTLTPAALDSGDLAATTDYRVVFAEILAKRCRVGDVATVFPGLVRADLGVVDARV